MNVNGYTIAPGANLSEANLYGANLSRANLYEANLYGANLHEANLYRANLSRTNLYGANLYGAILPNGETWETYLSVVVPQLLTSGGKTLKEVIETGCWECHNWANCPIAVAFGISEEEHRPVLLIPRIKEFIKFFDANLIPQPKV